VDFSDGDRVPRQERRKPGSLNAIGGGDVRVTRVFRNRLLDYRHRDGKDGDEYDDPTE
jgi:hypothetical protein